MSARAMGTRSVIGSGLGSRLWSIVGSLALAAPAAFGQGATPGYAVDELPIAPAGAFVGGFEVLPSGNYAVFDGTSIVELSAVDASLVQTIWTPDDFVYGAFLTLSPDGTKLYFGESRFKTVNEIDLATNAFTELLVTGFPYDLAFDPQGRPFLAYAFGFFNGSHVALVDFENQTLDDVLDSPEASGPLAFDADGNLYTATPDGYSFPPRPDATEILRFAAADLESAIGPGALDPSAGELLGLVDGVTGIALDEAGDVFITDPNSGVIVDLDAVTHAESIVATAGDYVSFLYLRQQRGTHGVFEPWQPVEAGELLAVRSDFFSFNGLTRVRPARPVVSTSPASPIPVGEFDFDITGGVPDGFALLFVSNSASDHELVLRNRTWPAPLYLNLDFTGFDLLPLFFDGLGEYHETLDNPGLDGTTAACQVLVGSTAFGPFYGTSAALEVVLD